MAFIIARHISLDLHEAETTHRGVEGWDEPVFYKGQICSHVRRYSDTLLLARKTWCGPLIATDLDGDRLTVTVPSESFRQWLIEKHGEVLDDAARAAGAAARLAVARVTRARSSLPGTVWCG